MTKPLIIALAAWLAGGAGPGVAQSGNEAARREEVVVTAHRHAADEQITQQVQKTLRDDPWSYAQHVTVTTDDGVVNLDGVVADSDELLGVLSLCRQIPGVRRVFSGNVEINAQLPDGG